MIADTKPKNLYPEWHPLIATPFRYSPPHPQARFRPPYGKNIFYASSSEETALHEHAFHFMKQRIHLNIETETGIRTLFYVNANDKNAFHVRNDSHFLAIINKNDYAASHQFVISHQHITFILYPSCRDPQQRDNAAILNIDHIEKSPKWETPIKFFYDNAKKQITWIDYQLYICWPEVC